MAISAKIIAYSRAPSGQLIITWELEYQRFFHSELMTHRLFQSQRCKFSGYPCCNNHQPSTKQPSYANSLGPEHARYAGESSAS